MDEKPAENPPAMVPRSRRRWLWPAAAVLLVAGVGVYVLLWGPFHGPSDMPLEGELMVTVTKKGREAQQSPPIEEPGVAPVRDGDKMHLIVRYNQPAFTYLVRFGTNGKVIPLYPWNQDSIDIQDIDERPPVCLPTKIVFNPMTISNGWKFDKHSGLETVLLLARRAPIGENVSLGKLLAGMPPAKLRDRGEVAILGLDRRATAPESLLALNRGATEEVRDVDAPLRTLMGKLKEHFELIRAVRFAHEGE